MATEARGGGARTNASSRVSPAPSRDSRYRSFTTPEDLAFKVASSLGRFLLYRKVKDELERIPARESVSTESGRSQVARRAARIATVIRGARLLLVNDILRRWPMSSKSYVISVFTCRLKLPPRVRFGAFQRYLSRRDIRHAAGCGGG